MKLEYDPDKHEYRLDGEKCPNVTAVLGVLGKPGMEWWGTRLAIEGFIALSRQATVDPYHPAASELIYKGLGALQMLPNAALDSASKRGSAVHQAFVEFCNTGELPNNEAVAGYIESLRAFLSEHKPTLLAFEQSVYSPSMKVCGTYDALLEIDGELALVDWKTSKAIYSSHHIQAAAYEGMRQELKEPPATPMVVRLKADGSSPEVAKSKATYEDFKAAVVLYEATKRIASKKAKA